MPNQAKDYLTATDFYRFLQCPHWPWYERFANAEEQGLRREVTDAERRRMEHGVAHERRVVEHLFTSATLHEVPMTGDAEGDWKQTQELMRAGVPLIYQGTLTFGDWTGRPDILERHEGQSSLGDWFYVPVDVKSTHALEKYQKLQLIFYASLLEKLQGHFPAEPAILNRDGERISFRADEMVTDFEEFVVELERIRAGEKPDPVLRKSCFDTGPWGDVCQRFAKETNDIALLFNVDVRKLRLLRGLGVRSIDDAAALDPVTLDGTAPGLRLHGLEVIKRQAQSLQRDLVLVREPVVLPQTHCEIHFDIESDPPNDIDYLYGLLVREPGKEDRYQSFVALSIDQEGEMWKTFLAWLETLPAEYVVYHYSVYEKNRLDLLEKRYGGSEWLNVFRTRMVDLKEIVGHQITFPLYFYGLKYIANFLGFSWGGEVTSGGQSVDVFEQFLETHDEKLFASLLQYNEKDVRATAFLRDWLDAYCKEITTYEKPYPWT